MFNHKVTHAFNLDKEQFAIIDDQNELFIIQFNEIQWDDIYNFEKKIYLVEAKIDLNKMQDQFNNNVIQEDTGDGEQILIDKQMEVVKFYNNEDLAGIARDMKKLVQNITKLEKRTARSVDLGNGKGRFRIGNGSMSVKRRRGKEGKKPGY